MAEVKTKVSNKSVLAFIKAIEDKEKMKDAKALLSIFKEVTGEKPKLWGESIIGFGMYHYESEKSSQKGDWPLTGFSPRKQNLTVYIMPGFTEYQALMKEIGKHKTSRSCLYFKKLSDINIEVLKKLIAYSIRDMKKKYKV